MTDREHVHLRQQDTRRLTYAAHIHRLKPSGLTIPTLSQYPNCGCHTPAEHHGAHTVTPLFRVMDL